MAKASKFIPEAPVVINLELTWEEAKVLADILSRIAGTYESRRGLTADISTALANVGLFSDLGNTDLTGRLEFSEED